MKVVTEKIDVLVVGHGSPDHAGNVDFEELIKTYQQHRPSWKIHYGYIEHAEPLLYEALELMARSSKAPLVVLPLILLEAGHVKDDIPEAIDKLQKNYPQTNLHRAEPLGVHPRMIDLLWNRAEAVGLKRGIRTLSARKKTEALEDSSENTVAIVVGRGSSHPDANSNFCRLVRLFAEETDVTWVLPCFIGVTTPSMDDALELAANLKPENLFIIPYYLFQGILVSRISNKAQQFSVAHPEIKVSVSKPISVDPQIFDLLDERVMKALEEVHIAATDSAIAIHSNPTAACTTADA